MKSKTPQDEQNEGDLAFSCSENNISDNQNQVVAGENKDTVTPRLTRRVKQTEKFFSCLCFSVTQTIEREEEIDTEQENPGNNHTQSQKT